ncbi:MAG: hypothetical protein HY532_08360 [Chloroflexi bacterium]|nr:hypothetical protein [Chloroflexota bacterium]
MFLAAMALAAGPAYAHGFGQKYSLPLPLWLYVTGAGAVVALSFLVIALFAQGNPTIKGYPTYNLLRLGIFRALSHRVVSAFLQALSVALLLLVMATGTFGNQDPLRNLAPTVVWVYWWVGLAYASALVGNLWALLNPWNALFSWADALYRRLNPGDKLSSDQPYPEKMGYWPAVVLFGLFAWVEIAYPRSAEPRSLATFAVIYTFITLAGMVVYGRRTWLKYGEAFSVVFGLLARFSPTEVRVTGASVCRSCAHKCDPEACVDCYDCWERAPKETRQLNLRPFGAGLLSGEIAVPSLLTLVLLTLATVAFDGFTSTPLWSDIVGALYPALRFMGGNAFSAMRTLGIVLVPLLFLGVYGVFSLLMAAAAGDSSRWRSYAHAFVFSLIPIALAYQLAHFLSFLLIQGQLLIPLASDPFGWGWDLMGSAGYLVNINVVGARFAWFAAVIAIVIGHIIAVYVAHAVAVRFVGGRRAALRSQYPMMALMVGYTMISLWIIAQPIVEVMPG